MKYSSYSLHGRLSEHLSGRVPRILRVFRILLIPLIAGIWFPLFPFLGPERMLLAQTDEEPQTVTTTETTTSAGTISDFEPDTFIIRSDRSPEPLRYSYSKTTTFVDENGAPVSREIVKSGVPVTVYYAREGDRFIASKVVVRRVTTNEPERVIEKKTTTTTTDK